MKTIVITFLLALATAFPKQMTADFRLVRTSPLLQGEQVFLGKITYKTPDYVRWEYTSPEKAVWEMNGKKGNLSPQVKRIMEIINACVEGKEVVRDFKVTRRGNQMTIVPVRRDMRKVIEKISVVLSDMPGVANSVEIQETNGGKTKIVFSNVKYVM